MPRTTDTPARLISIKSAAERSGLPYSSIRDSVFRGEIRVFRSGGTDNERYARWYLDAREFERFVESRMETLA